jgi:hypothetical protein
VGQETKEVRSGRSRWSRLLERVFPADLETCSARFLRRRTSAPISMSSKTTIAWSLKKKKDRVLRRDGI